MSHDPAMHAMMASTWFLMAVPFLFVAIGVFWYRQSMAGREQQLLEEAGLYGGHEVETR